LQAMASDHAGANAAFSRLVQSLMSSLLLGIGCWLSIRGSVEGSGMIVASILGGKVLSPLVRLIGNWRTVAGFMESWRRLEEALGKFPLPVGGMRLPAPKGALQVENIVAGAPGSKAAILKGIAFSLAPGASLAVVGPSAAGKSSLARVLVGIWPTTQGKVRLDGSDIFTWGKDELGRHVGYLPQNAELFDGTIAENIARFGVHDRRKLDEAVALAGLSEVVSGFAEGYDTRIGEEGVALSGGERKLIALARTVYGMPKYVVLDEPDSMLDEAGHAALIRTIARLRSNGSTVIVMTHKMPLLEMMEYVLYLADGQMRRFGPRDEVLGRSGSASTPQHTLKTS